MLIAALRDSDLLHSSQQIKSQRPDLSSVKDKKKITNVSNIYPAVDR